MRVPVGRSLAPPSSPLLLHACLALTLLVGVGRTSVSRCPEGHYRDGHSQRCQACSTCPVNQIIRKPCNEASNTLCGPFSEFMEFHQAPRPSLEVGDLDPLPDEEGGLLGPGPGPGVVGGGGDTRGADDNRSRKLAADEFLHSLDDDVHPPEDPHPEQETPHHHKHQKAPWHHRGHRKDQAHAEESPDPPGVVVGGPEGAPPVEDDSGGARGRPEAPSLQDRDGEEQQWKVLALALIVVLCIVCIFLIVFVFVICYMRSRRAHLKQVLYSAADKGAGSSSRQPCGPTTPFQSMQYVPVLTHAQTRAAGAGTSGAAAAAAAAMVVAPSGALVDSSYLYSEDYDADTSSGQTVSTTKSSDYVYFKSPHNGNNVYDV